MKDTKETIPFKYSKIDAHINSQRLSQHAQGSHGSTTDGVPELSGSGHKSTSLIQMLSPIDNHSQTKNW